MEPAEIVANHKEDAKGLLWVLHFWQKVGRKTERESNLGGLVEVGLEDMPGSHSQ
jgi:hypothetical protein